MSTPAPASVLAPKPHYAALDGLRGVAAVMVVLFHMFEGSARDFQFHMDQIINHGYLSVDFFFMLSGFVIGYAYDDRWEKMNLWNFFNPWWSWGCCWGESSFTSRGLKSSRTLRKPPYGKCCWS